MRWVWFYYSYGFWPDFVSEVWIPYINLIIPLETWKEGELPINITYIILYTYNYLLKFFFSVVNFLQRICLIYVLPAVLSAIFLNFGCKIKHIKIKRKEREDTNIRNEGQGITVQPMYIKVLTKKYYEQLIICLQIWIPSINEPTPWKTQAAISILRRSK